MSSIGVERLYIFSAWLSAWLVGGALAKHATGDCGARCPMGFEGKAEAVPVSGADRLGMPPKETVLDAAAAARLAASLANSEAKRRFNATPFTASQDTPTLSNGRWSWRATAGYGKGDLQAIVSFTPTGSKPEIRIQMLTLEPPLER